MIDAQILADINLFMEWGAMGDNVLKNIYFVLKDTGEEYEMRFILWDTDMTFGIHWTPTGLVYENESMVQSAPHRPETWKYAETNPDFNSLMAEKWAVLRETVLTEENIQANQDECYDQLISSGVYSREVAKWGCNSYGGADNKEAMEEYIALKLDWMDEKYLN